MKNNIDSLHANIHTAVHMDKKTSLISVLNYDCKKNIWRFGSMRNRSYEMIPAI